MELSGIPVVANFATTATDWKIYQVDYYNLDMILSNFKEIRYSLNDAVKIIFLS
jgi:hypothetical protein